MTKGSHFPLTTLQQVGLILLRTLIGWHFLYEGYYKLALPAWSSDGQPLGRWTSAGYLRSATGPFAGMFHKMAQQNWTAWIDLIVAVTLVLVGISLILGLLTQAGCWGALFLLILFYLSSIPIRGTPQPGNEGTYLIVSKNLIEWAAVLVLLSFRTGKIAGLDLLWGSARTETVMEHPSSVEA
jgi:thiosulfate dehydrogenase (quinone) large subunit